MTSNFQPSLEDLDDVTGHKRVAAAESEDVEGHKRVAAVESEDDVEGHRIVR